MTTPQTKTRVDLEDLRIKERPRRSGGGRLVILLLLLLIPGAFLAGRYLRFGGTSGASGGSDGAVSVQVEKVGEAVVRSASPGGSFIEGGWIEVPSYHPIVVTALVPGRVEELLVLEGASVIRDQTIARIYSKDREDELRLANAAVAEADAQLSLFVAGYRKEDIAKAKAEVDRLAEDIFLATKIADRTRGLVPTGAASEEDLERDESAVASARAALRVAEGEHARLVAGFRVEEIAKAKAAVDRAKAARDLAASELSYCEVKSPGKGVVMERFVTAGTSLTPGDLRIVSLYDPGDLQVRVDVRHENASRVFVGQNVLVYTDSEPDKGYPGVVIRVDPVADLRKNTIQAKVKLTETGSRLHPEMICRAEFLAEEAEAPPPVVEGKEVTVPRASILGEGDRQFVFVVRKGRANRTNVKVGEARGGRVVIHSGLSAGDLVVLDPPSGLEDGNRVKESR